MVYWNIYNSLEFEVQSNFHFDLLCLFSYDTLPYHLPYKKLLYILFLWAQYNTPGRDPSTHHQHKSQSVFPDKKEQ